VIADCGHVMLD